MWETRRIWRYKRKQNSTTFLKKIISDYQSDREVTRKDGENLAKQLNAVFIETSAKDNNCVTDLFQVCEKSERKLNLYDK